MELNLSVFQEPRGVMRIFQFVFSICAFAVLTGYTGSVDFTCVRPADFSFKFEYPFKLLLNKYKLYPQNHTCANATVSIFGDFSSDARFFVATGVLAMLYSIVIVLIYTKFDNLYKSNGQIPLIDFILSVILAVLWLSSSAAWANGLTGLKHVTDPSNIKWINAEPTCTCPVTTGNFSSLNISVILGFLNFFLWAADLWFLYKETEWFQNARAVSSAGV